MSDANFVEQRGVTFSQAIKKAFNNYVNFNGRACRSEFWWWALFVILVCVVCEIIDFALAGGSDQPAMVLTIIWSLAILLPSLGLYWRRLHDIGKGGGWFFIGLVPFVGGIILLIFMLQPSEQGDNRFGPKPQ